MDIKPYKAFCNWSGGKDSALACYYAMQDNQYSVEKLVTNIEHDSQRISMHGVTETLLDLQSAAMGISLQKLRFPSQPSMHDYETIVTGSLQSLKNEAYTHNIFGDIFLEDLKRYRETSLKTYGIKAVFPLWKKDTRILLQSFLDLGFKTVVVCLDASKLDKSFAGRIIDNNFIKDLPAGVDPCGENGEFHTFVFDGPIFKSPVSYSLGAQYFKELKAPANLSKESTSSNEKMGFWFRDIHPC